MAVSMFFWEVFLVSLYCFTVTCKRGIIHGVPCYSEDATPHVLGAVHSWWELVYKAVTGGPFGAYELFTSDNTRNINNLAAQQLTNQVLDHYKSEVFNNWQSNDIYKIRVSYYAGGTEAQYFVFNATGSTKTNWFSRYRVLESSYDISAFAVTTGKGGEYFSIKG
ncbi:uncharacterized protein LOC134280470 [Saccostrea cucullata]|uniref:uncharacterized protein LOC134280470 n=1 Tax=Saccostrea cuccullata TaxID=36930 RepID=UPI002ED020DE